jgi:spermidine synthase
LAILWQYTQGDIHYQVRSAGATMRLYTNGAFHSQYNPNHLFTGGIWDLLAIPALYSDVINHPNNTPNLLILGVGGGTAIHLFNQLLDHPPITGIEYDRVHLDIARQHFKCNTKNTSLVHADAYHWIKTNTQKFNVLLDDLFVDGPNDPVRPETVNRAWMKQLSSALSNDAVLIQNHLAPATAKKVALDNWTRDHFKHALLFHHPMYANGILALYKTPVDIRQARFQIGSQIKERHPGALKRLKYRVETIY